MSVGKHGLVIRAVYGVDVTDPSEPIVLAETPIPELHQDQAIELEAADTEPESEIVENPEGGFDLVVGGQVVDHSDYLYLGCFSGKNDGEGTETTPAS